MTATAPRLDVQELRFGIKVTSERSVALPAQVFDVELNVPLIHQVVVAQLAAARQGTHKVKTRGEVRGGGKKPYRQKGTGRARQGSVRAPQFVGGGVVHGPVPRSYKQRTPKKMKAAALRSALSDRARNGRVHVITGIVPAELDAQWTKTALANLGKVTDATKVLVVAERSDELTWRSLRNASTVHLLDPGQLNTYDVLISDDVVFTADAFTAFLNGAPTPTHSPVPIDTTQGNKGQLLPTSNLVDLRELRGKVLKMGSLRHHEPEPDREAMAVEVNGHESVVFQQLPDMVCVSWPTKLDIDGAILELVAFGRAVRGRIDVFADLDDSTTREFSRSSKALQRSLDALADKIVELHVQTANETVLWRRPLADEERPRWVVYQQAADSRRIMPLLLDTAERPLVDAVAKVFDDEHWTVSSLASRPA